MSERIARRSASVPVPLSDVGRPQMAKAELAVHSGPSTLTLVWSAVLKDALDRHYGSLKAAAFAMGQYDPSQLTRDLDTGKFKQERLELCDDAAKAAIASALYAAFGDADPKARVRRLLRNARRAIEELAEAVDHAA